MNHIIHNLKIVPLPFFGIAVFLLLIVFLSTRKVVLSFLVFYTFIVISVTLLSRRTSTSGSAILEPLWSYRNFLKNESIRDQIVANIAMFIPIGLLFPFVFNWKKGILISFLFSILIEVLQFITHRGLAEIDDVISNTIGLLIGTGLVVLGKKIVNYWSSK